MFAKIRVLLVGMLLILVASRVFAYTTNVGYVSWQKQGETVYDSSGTVWSGDDFNGAAGTGLAEPPYELMNGAEMTQDGSGALNVTHAEPHTAAGLPNYASDGSTWLGVSNGDFILNLQAGPPDPGYAFTLRVATPVDYDTVSLWVASTYSGFTGIGLEDETQIGHDSLTLMDLSGYTSIGLKIHIDSLGECTPYYWLNPSDGLLSADDPRWTKLGLATTTLDTTKIHKIIFATSTTDQPGPKFDSESGTLTNPYFSLRVNDRLIFCGHGGYGRIYEGHTLYQDAVGNEIVDSVNCLRLNTTSTLHDYMTLWFAQDVDGNVWLLRMRARESDDQTDETYEFGAANPVFVMPAEPTVGQIVQDFRDYFGEYAGYGIIQEIGIPCPSANCGDLDSSPNCLRIEKAYMPPDIDNAYYALNVGLVKEAHEDNAQEDPRGWDLMEAIKKQCPSDLDNNGVVDGFDLATFAAEFGNTCD